jgi:pyruvate dehydrogenase E2 component (dihydrolipoamide acetyltransferase)
LFISPLAKKTAEELGIDVGSVTGTGPNARILKADVLEAKQSKKLGAPSQVGVSDESAYTDIDNTNIRKVIAERLSFSKQNIPHYYVTVSVNVDNLLKLRGKLNNVSKTKISVNDMVIKAAALASVKVPEANSSWQGDFVRRYNNVNMSVAI